MVYLLSGKSLHLQSGAIEGEGSKACPVLRTMKEYCDAAITADRRLPKHFRPLPAWLPRALTYQEMPLSIDSKERRGSQDRWSQTEKKRTTIATNTR